jgi:two-component system chemotaxis response regulator CheB
MNSRFRVLVVDDSAVVRRIVTSALRDDPEIDVCGEAVDGVDALLKIASLSPDAVTLDLEMPRLDGLGALRELRKTKPRLPVVMFSTLTERGAVATLDALALGADDYVAKPSNVGGFDEALGRLKNDLVPKLKALCRRRGAAPGGAAPAKPRKTLRASEPPPAPAAAPVRPTPAFANGSSPPADIVAIASSTGGPAALTAFFTALPRTATTPIVVTQHMPPLFTRLLAERLAAATGRDVKEATAGERLEDGMVRIAPGERHLVLVRDGGGVRTELSDGPPENSCRPAADPMLRSVATLFGARALVVVLTGMGRDGAAGAEAVRRAGGAILAQDEASSVVWGMPGAAVHAGVVAFQGPPEALAAETGRRVRRATRPVGSGV